MAFARSIFIVALLLPALARAESLAPLAGPALVDGVPLPGGTRDGRIVQLATSAGQKLRVTAYGSGMFRVQAVGAGQDFFDGGDLRRDRYEMVVPSNHAQMTGRIHVVDAGLAQALLLTLPSGAALSITKSPIRLHFSQNGKALLDDGARGLVTDPLPSASFAPRGDEHFTGLGHPPFGRLPDGIDLKNKSIQRNRSLDVGAFIQAPLLVPFYVSSRGYGVFVNSTFPNRFTFQSQDYSFSLEGGQLDYFFIAGPTIRTVLDRYTQLTGRPRMLPGGALGLGLSDKLQDNDTLGHANEDFWKSKIAKMRDGGFPMTILIHDNGWRGAKDGVWQWDLRRYPNPNEWALFSEKNGVANMLDFNRRDAQLTPGFLQGIADPQTRARAFMPGVKGPEGFVDFPDFTSQAVRDSFWNVMARATFDIRQTRVKFPGDYIWLDEFDFPINPQQPMLDGKSWKETANNYFFLLEKAVGEGWDRTFQGSKRPYIMSRGSSAGAQRFGFLWSGDLQSTQADMQMSIRSMQTAGLSGFPFWSHDAGGFFGDPKFGPERPGDRRHPHPVAYRNWAAAMGSFSPFWKPHGLGFRFPQKDLFEPGITGPVPAGFSDQEIADMKRAGENRIRLFPYNYTIAREAHDTGTPMARAMMLDNQDNGLAWSRDQQYMWGDQLLVAPVTDDGSIPKPNQVAISIWFPRGLWWDFNNPTVALPKNGIAPENFLATTGLAPVFAKAGSIIPEFRFAPTIKELDRGVLQLEVFPAADGSFELIEDDLETEAFLPERGGATRTTRLSWQDGANRVVVSDPVGRDYTGAPSKRIFVVVLRGQQALRNFRAIQGGSQELIGAGQATTVEEAIANAQRPVNPVASAIFSSGTRTLTLVTTPKTVVTRPVGSAPVTSVVIEPVPGQ